MARTKKYVHSIIVFLLMFGFGLLPPIGDLTPLGMHGIGIFIGMAYGWTTLGMFWPSLLGILAVSMTGYMTISDTFNIAFGDSTMLQCLSAIIFAGYLETSGLSYFIARWFACRKFAIGRPWLFSLCMLAGIFVLSLCTSGTASVIIAWAFFYEVCRVYGLTRNDMYTTVMLSCINIACIMGAICMPYQPMPVVFLGCLSEIGIEINTLVFTGIRFVISVFITLVCFAFCVFVLKPDISKMQVSEDKFADLRELRMSSEQKIAIGCLLVLHLGLFIPNVLPKTWPFVSTIQSLGLVGLVSIILIVLIIIEVKKNGSFSSIMDFQNIMKTGVNFELIVLLAATAPIASLLESDDSGVFDIIISLFGPIAENVGSFGFIALTALILGFMTQFSHNIVLARVMTPIILPIAISAGIDPVLVVMIILLPCQMALCTPGASANAALIWGNTEWTQKKYVIIIAFTGFIISMIATLAIILPVLSLIY